MNSHRESQVFFYPFHLCHERTLQHLLAEYHTIHFMDYMALRLTELSGMTAFPDRMGDTYPELLASGRIVQGYPAGGPLDAVMAADIDRDLRDASWRDIFHQALRDDRRFLRGLFDLSHGFVVGDATVPGPAAFLRLTAEERRQNPASVEKLRHQSRSRLRAEAAYEFEYAFALVKTSAVLRHTIRLCTTLDIEAVTDSEGHYRLLELTRRRETLPIRHRHLPRTGY